MMILRRGCLWCRYTCGFSNCDLFFDKVFGDDYEHISDFRYFDRMKSFDVVSDVVNHKVDGRVDDKERIIVYNLGVASHDVFFAEKIYDISSKKKEIESIHPNHKNWYYDYLLNK